MNANINRAKNKPAYKPQDFMPKRGAARPEKLSPNQMLDRLMLLTVASGGKIVEKP